MPDENQRIFVELIRTNDTQSFRVNATYRLKFYAIELICVKKVVSRNVQKGNVTIIEVGTVASSAVIEVCRVPKLLNFVGRRVNIVVPNRDNGSICSLNVSRD